MFRQLIIMALALPPSLGLAQVPDSNAELNDEVIPNSLDMSVLASCFGQDPATNSPCSVADVVGDGDSNGDDFRFVVEHFDQAYPWKLYPIPKFVAGGARRCKR